jgi:hypothetical protein
MPNNPSRRSFVKQSVAAAIAVSAAPAFLRGAEMKTLGQGRYKYEVVENWGALPDGKKYGNTHGVCETADGRIFIHNASPTGDCTCIFDPDGKFMSSWGQKFGDCLKHGAHGMQLRKEGSDEFLYLATTGCHKVYKTTLDGEVVLELTYPKEAKNVKGEPCYVDDKKYSPTNIAFGPNGDFYVADGYGSNYVHQYDSKGAYIRTFGGSGKEPGQLSQPHGIWCDTRDASNPQILVADRANVRLQWFTLDGKFIKMVDQELRFPCHFDQRGTDLLIPDLHGRLTVFDKDNKLVTHIGDNPDPKKRGNPHVKPNELVPGEFVTPHQAIWDRAGNIYCAEWLPYGRVTKLKLVS